MIQLDDIEDLNNAPRVCGYALNLVRTKEPDCYKDLASMEKMHSVWDRGGYHEHCGKPAVLMVAAISGCVFYCANCFLVDAEVVCKASMVVRLRGFDQSSESVLAAYPFLPPKACDNWPWMIDFLRSVVTWNSTVEMWEDLK